MKELEHWHLQPELTPLADSGLPNSQRLGKQGHNYSLTVFLYYYFFVDFVGARAPLHTKRQTNRGGPCIVRLGQEKAERQQHQQQKSTKVACHAPSLHKRKTRNHERNQRTNTHTHTKTKRERDPNSRRGGEGN